MRQLLLLCVLAARADEIRLGLLQGGYIATPVLKAIPDVFCLPNTYVHTMEVHYNSNQWGSIVGIVFTCSTYNNLNTNAHIFGVRGAVGGTISTVVDGDGATITVVGPYVNYPGVISIELWQGVEGFNVLAESDDIGSSRRVGTVVTGQIYRHYSIIPLHTKLAGFYGSAGDTNNIIYNLGIIMRHIICTWYDFNFSPDDRHCSCPLGQIQILARPGQTYWTCTACPPNSYRGELTDDVCRLCTAGGEPVGSSFDTAGVIYSTASGKSSVSDCNQYTVGIVFLFWSSARLTPLSVVPQGVRRGGPGLAGELLPLPGGHLQGG
jgi:hypothetical protein